MRQLRQPRLADIVASSLRDEILSSRLKEGDSLPRHEHLFEEYRVSLPAVREAMRILETEGLVSVRRGNVGGAVVHKPSAERTARMISMVLQSRQTTLTDVSAALLTIEPVCARLCAEREDRATEVVPHLRDAIEAQRAGLDDPAYTPLARRFHEVLVDRCGNETLKVVIGSLETIWSAHESTVWGEASDEPQHDSQPRRTEVKAMRRAALRDHEKILAAIEKGDQERAAALAARHLAATRTSTLSSTTRQFVEANLLGDVNLPPPRR